MNLYEWANDWNIPVEAMLDLQQRMGTTDDEKYVRVSGESEAAVQTRVRMEASRAGGRLWRNNVGAGELMEGGFMRWGLCNESKQMNEKIKSSDLIGLKPVLITPEMVGRTIGQFMAREIKHSDWQFNPNSKREQAQLKYLQLVLSLGGDAAFANKEGTIG